jgi:tRNA uridine 5-carbamoylmethylation protein Kti12
VSVLEICRGLPGSGKTTYALTRQAEWPRGQIARVNRDMLRGGLFNTRYEPDSDDFEYLITSLQHSLIWRLLSQGVQVICDDTNLYDEHLLGLVAIARSAAAGWTIQDFTTVPLPACIRRDATRPPGKQVGAKIITAMFDKHLADHYPAPLPTPEGA